jgi:hypothetical protein
LLQMQTFSAIYFRHQFVMKDGNRKSAAIRMSLVWQLILRLSSRFCRIVELMMRWMSYFQWYELSLEKQSYYKTIKYLMTSIERVTHLFHVKSEWFKNQIKFNNRRVQSLSKVRTRWKTQTNKFIMNTKYLCKTKCNDCLLCGISTKSSNSCATGFMSIRKARNKWMANKAIIAILMGPSFTVVSISVVTVLP